MAAIRPLALSFALLLFFPMRLSAKDALPTYHGGTLLSGDLNLALIWYGQFGRAQKKVIRTFIKSLNYNAAANLQPQVSSWWKTVEGFHDAIGKKSSHINVKVVRQVTDTGYSVGKIITADFVRPLVQKATTGSSNNTIPAIFTAKDVSVHGLCLGQCSDHGVSDNQPYILVGNAETECPGSCCWPFYKEDGGARGAILKPPNGNVAADAMVVAFAQALVETVTNPYETGFFQQTLRRPIGAASACQGIFGSGAVPGSTGKVIVDPGTGGGFNAYGSRGSKFLLPAIWNPKTQSCWTLM